MGAREKGPELLMTCYQVSALMLLHVGGRKERPGQARLHPRRRGRRGNVAVSQCLWRPVRRQLGEGGATPWGLRGDAELRTLKQSDSSPELR